MAAWNYAALTFGFCAMAGLVVYLGACMKDGKVRLMGLIVAVLSSALLGMAGVMMSWEEIVEKRKYDPLLLVGSAIFIIMCGFQAKDLKPMVARLLVKFLRVFTNGHHDRKNGKDDPGETTPVPE